MTLRAEPQANDHPIPAWLDQGDGTTPDDVAGPILAGMRARAVADLCETLGLAAALIDGSGAVLHITSGAAGLIGSDLRLTAGHLTGSSRKSNRALQDLIGSAIEPAGSGAALNDAQVGQGNDRMVLRAFRYSDDSPYQFLRAILVITRGAPLVQADSLQVLDALSA